MRMQMRGWARKAVILAVWAALAGVWGQAVAQTPDPIVFGWAVERGDVKVVRAWLDAGLDPEFQGPNLGSGLMIAAWTGNLEMMALFIERGVNPRRANGNGEQPLQLAAWNGHTEAVRWLLANGANLNREGNYWGALHYAVFNGHRELAQELIARGAQINARSPNGSTPLMMAAREGREEMIKPLLEAGADPQARNDWGDNALTLAMRYDHYRLGKMISSPEEFAIAARAPKESFGEARRSASAPSEIETLLRQIREAEGEGKPSEHLHAQLREAVNAFRRNAATQKYARKPMPLPYQPRSIVITAKRGNPAAERAQVVVDGKAQGAAPNSAAPAGGQKPSIRVTPVDQRAKQAEIAETMRQIRLREGEGQTADDLRQKLAEQLERLSSP